MYLFRVGCCFLVDFSWLSNKWKVGIELPMFYLYRQFKLNSNLSYIDKDGRRKTVLLAPLDTNIVFKPVRRSNPLVQR